jgi:hypothetical protein
MSPSYALGLLSALFMLFSAIRVLLIDGRHTDRIIVMCSLIAQIGNIALHSHYPPEHTAVSMMVIEGALLCFILQSDFVYRKSYAAIVLGSITLSFLWGIDYTLNTGLLYVNGEPSVYTVLSAILTIAQAVIFTRTARHGRTDTDSRFYNRSGRSHKVLAK